MIPLEAAERRRRDLTSAVKRLRVAVMTDPSLFGEFADTLVESVGNRLLAWSFTEAAADAPESVVLSARILAERGPIGPYASAEDAVRYVTASVQLAAVQAGLGQPEAAGRTLDALDAWRVQLGRLPLLERLTPMTAVWALAVRARAAQEVAVANGYADAALLRLYAAGLDLDAEAAYLAVTVHLATAAVRWAAGHTEAALAHHRLALTRYRAAIAGLDGAARPALAQVAWAPLPDLFGPFALRLEASGDQAGALAVRRDWLALAERLATADAAVTEMAKAALSQALTRVGRGVEADQFAPPVPTTEIPLPVPGPRIDWPALAPERVLSTGSLTVTASVRLQRDEQAASAEGSAARAAAERAEERLRAKAEQLAAEQAVAQAEAERRAEAQAATAAQSAAERARAEAKAEAERRAAQEAAEQAAAAERRRERAAAREDARTVDPEVLRSSAAELPAARQQVVEAGDEPAPLAAAHERLAGLLRPLATADPDRYRDELVAALETLVSLRWRLGDPAGSREAARERKTW